MGEPTIRWAYLGNSREEALTQGERFSASQLEAILQNEYGSDREALKGLIGEGINESKLFARECLDTCPHQGRVSFRKRKSAVECYQSVSVCRVEKCGFKCPIERKQSGDPYKQHIVRQKLVLDRRTKKIIRRMGTISPPDFSFTGLAPVLYRRLRQQIQLNRKLQETPESRRRNVEGGLPLRDDVTLKIDEFAENISHGFSHEGHNHKIIFEGLHTKAKLRYFPVLRGETLEENICPERKPYNDILVLPSNLEALLIWIPNHAFDDWCSFMNKPGNQLLSGLGIAQKEWIQSCQEYEHGYFQRIEGKFIRKQSGQLRLREYLRRLEGFAGVENSYIDIDLNFFDLSVMVDAEDLRPGPDGVVDNCTLFDSPGSIARIYSDKDGWAMIGIQVAKSVKLRRAVIKGKEVPKGRIDLMPENNDPIMWYSFKVEKPQRIYIFSDDNNTSGYIVVNVFPRPN